MQRSRSMTSSTTPRRASGSFSAFRRTSCFSARRAAFFREVYGQLLGSVSLRLLQSFDKLRLDCLLPYVTPCNPDDKQPMRSRGWDSPTTGQTPLRRCVRKAHRRLSFVRGDHEPLPEALSADFPCSLRDPFKGLNVQTCLCATDFVLLDSSAEVHTSGSVGSYFCISLPLHPHKESAKHVPCAFYRASKDR